MNFRFVNSHGRFLVNTQLSIAFPCYLPIWNIVKPISLGIIQHNEQGIDLKVGMYNFTDNQKEKKKDEVRGIRRMNWIFSKSF